MLFVRERRQGHKNTKAFSYFLPYSRFLRFSRTIVFFRFVPKVIGLLLAQD
jgi:hypothetical protein